MAGRGRPVGKAWQKRHLGHSSRFGMLAAVGSTWKRPETAEETAEETGVGALADAMAGLARDVSGQGRDRQGLDGIGVCARPRSAGIAEDEGQGKVN